MTTAEYLQNLINDNKFFRELAQFYGEDISSSAGLMEIAKALVRTEPTTQQSIIVDGTGKSLPVCATSKVFLNKISGNAEAVSIHKVAPYNVTSRTGVKILAGGAIIKQTKVDELSRFEVQIYDNGKPVGKQLNTQFIEGDYQIAFTVTSTTTSINFGISGKKADAKASFKLPTPGDYVYHFTTAMNTDGTQRWYDMRITLPDGMPYIDEDGLVAAYIIPEEIRAISGYGEYNPANMEEYNYIDGSDGSYVIVGRKINGIWTSQDEERIPVAFNPWLNTNNANIIKIEGTDIMTNSNILCRSYEEPKEKHTATLTFNLNGKIEGFDYALLSVNDELYDKYIIDNCAFDLPIGAKVSLEIKTIDGYTFTTAISPNNYNIDLSQEWNIFEDTVISINIETAIINYTLTVNLEGDYEAYYDGYTIYVDGAEFARIDSSGTFSIPHGATVSTYNNSFGINGYEHSESVMPLPSYNADGSWIMNNDYVINVVATLFETVIINIETWFPNGEGVITTQFKLKDGTTKMDTLTFNEQTVLSYEVLQGSNFEIISLYDNAHTSFNIYSNDLPETSGQALTTFMAINDGTITIESTSS